MSFQISSQRVGDRKKRKLTIDIPDEIAFDCNVDLRINYDLKVIEDQSLLEGHRDLFGELIPPDECVTNAEVKKKSNKKTPRSKKRKQPYEELLFDTPSTRPKRLFIPTPKIIKIMNESYKELCSLMSPKTSQNNVSIVSTNSINVSGVEQILDSPISSIRSETKINKENNENIKKSQRVLEGKLQFFINTLYLPFIIKLILIIYDVKVFVCICNCNGL